MNESTLSIIALGISALGLIYTMFRNLKSDIQTFRSDIQNFRDEMKSELSEIKSEMKEMNGKISDLDKRLYAVETVLHMKDCCVLKQDQSLKKAE